LTASDDDDSGIAATSYTIDGGVHRTQAERDLERHDLLEFLGLRVIRIPTETVEKQNGGETGAGFAPWAPTSLGTSSVGESARFDSEVMTIVQSPFRLGRHDPHL